MKKILALVMALCMLCGVALAETEVEATYTYNNYTSTFPTTWNLFQYETETDGTFADYQADGYYAFDFNETHDGYVMKPAMAVDFPVDVTADYVGEQWNIKEGETARAWKITLRDNLAWNDGTPITAHDFEKSAMMLLDSKAANYRADSLYTGNMVITNAEAFLKQGSTSEAAFGALINNYGEADMASFLANHGTEKGYINWKVSFGDTYDFETQTWTGAAEDKIVETPLTIAELYTFYTEGPGAAYATWASAENLKEWANDELYGMYTYPAVDWANVGFKAISDTELVMIIEKPLEGFYLLYSLTGSWLVKEDLYNACATETDGVYTNNYGTSLATTASYGPWVITEFQSDKIIRLEKNPYWYGYTLPENEGLYQTTAIVYEKVAEASTAMEMFLAGKLDVKSLNKDEMVDYATSDYRYDSEGDSIFAMVFNPNLEALTANQATAGENINKSIITVKEFRMAMSFGMDRAAFCLAADPTNSPGYALYSGQIISDPENGVAYRSTEEAKDVLLNFWGLADEVGEGKMYLTKDEAIDSITGYNEAMAKEYFNKAYDIAIEQGLMDEDDVIEIIIGTPNLTSVAYNNGYDFIVNNYTKIVEGTKLEGKLTFKRDGTLGNGYAAALQNNQVDMLFFVGWTGSTFDPYGLMEAYTSKSYQYDPSWDTTTSMLTINLEGVDYTASVWDWTTSISGAEIKAKNAAGEEVQLTREQTNQNLFILAALEDCVLQNYDFIPLTGDNSAALKGMQIEYFLEDEVFPLGRGGVKYMTYNYTDAEWDAFVAEQGGVLNYK